MIAPRPPPEYIHGGLTPREYEVLQHMAAGESTNKIGAELFIALPSVRNHINSIITKLGVHSRAGAVATMNNPDKAAAILTFCAASGMRLTVLQKTLIRSAFRTHEVGCLANGEHDWLPRQSQRAPWSCVCGKHTVT